MNFYKRNLPHWQPEGAEYFITFRLAESLPKEVINRIKNERDRLLKEANDSSTDESDKLTKLQDKIRRRTFKKYEAQLDKGETGPMWLANKQVANLVEEAWHHRDGKQYDLYAYCIMSNHVHLVFRVLQRGDPSKKGSRFSDYPVTDLMQKLKSYTAVHANKVLKKTGQFWHRESYDRVIRNAEELENTIAYTLNNPVKAGLVEKWTDWSYSYCKGEFLPTFS